MPFAQGDSRTIPAPLLDHVVVLLDGPTFRDISACDMLREQFARVKPKNVTSSVAGQYSALGLAGENTLLELFDGALPGPRRLTGGLVFSFEHPGSVQRARALFDTGSGIGGHYELVHRHTADTDEFHPWYHMFRTDLGEDSPLLLFFNEVTPEYFDSVSARRGPGGELLRSGYLDAAFGTGTRDRRWLRDITAVTLRVRPQRAAGMADALTALGYRTTTDATDDAAAGSGPTYRIAGPGVDITLVGSATAPEGVLDITTDLHDAPQRDQEFVFGDTSRLVLRQHGTAHWTFTPPA
ncbi:hypothetical protein GA0074692_2012 [Micromonospora pallida]|uniref:Glyoxalase-like domain-containing protein n=1 Tax=Micromonospora pallida TaxID=145854 RepID=A0A1C6S8C8_9ACTN|nr:DUF5829 family protein [Micromonospora pallida]SCL25708.1 hypothetical protein GA0074692_2012 [Micromonospora pallida]